MTKYLLANSLSEADDTFAMYDMRSRADEFVIVLPEEETLMAGMPIAEGDVWAVVAGVPDTLVKLMQARYGAPLTVADLFHRVFDIKAIHPKLLNRVTP